MLLDNDSILTESCFISINDYGDEDLIFNKESILLCHFSIICTKLVKYLGRISHFSMDSHHSKSFEQLLRCQKKEDIKSKLKKTSNSTNKKVNTFKSSLEKLFRLKSKSEKSLKNEDLIVGMIPRTIYLSPHQTVSLSRDTWYLNETQPTSRVSKESTRHSCSDFVCRRSSTFCMMDVKKGDTFTIKEQRSANRSVSPPTHGVFCPVKEEDFQTEKNVPKVPHSVSMPAHLSKSHQNIMKLNQGDLENIKPAKRTVRKKGLFNCSLFRKRSNSNSKSREKMSDLKSGPHTRSRGSLNRSSLSDRCLTLPNLKSSEVDLTGNIDHHQLVSMDLIKDYLNRSENSLHSTLQRNSSDSNTQFPTSVQNSPLSATNCKCDLKPFKTPKLGMCDSMILESPGLSQSVSMQQSASFNHNLVRCSPLTINSAFDSTTTYSQFKGPTLVNEKPKPPCVRQISAPIHYQPPPTTSSHPYLSPAPTNSAFQFWTRPYQEKMNASRRRLLDDKVGSKEALLRSLSPHNLKGGGDLRSAIYDNPYHTHLVQESFIYSDDPIPIISSSKPGQYHLMHDCGPRRSASPVIENRLSESPVLIPKRLDSIYQRCSSHYLIYNTDLKNEPSKPPTPPTLPINQISQSRNETNRTSLEKIVPFPRSEPIPEYKDTKSVNSSSELGPTRTPTPPHSFAESPVSSIYPVPNEFGPKSLGKVNLLFKSDDEEEDQDDEVDDPFSHVEVEPVPPLPPPRTDSVIRSLQAQLSADADKSELEYDISDEFPPVFSGANIDRCDIEQYHKWLEKLPYKLSEFPNLLQCRKSSVSACKNSHLAENSNSSCKKIDLTTLKQFKQSRKSIKSWNTSESSKPDDDESLDHQELCVTLDSCSMKKSFSYDQSLNNSDGKSDVENTSPGQRMHPSAAIDVTLLKQYSHLYSLKPSPSQTPQISEFASSALKFHRSKSIDLRNIVNNVSGTPITILEKMAQKRKSVPNANFTPGITVTKLSGNTTVDATKCPSPKYKVYPML